MSFHGLYRKFSEVDLFEAIRVKSCTMRNKPLSTFDKSTLNSSFMDNTMFSIFFNEIKYLAAIVKWLEHADLPA